MRHLVGRTGEYSFLPPFDSILEKGTYYVERVESFSSYRQDGSIELIYKNPSFATPFVDVDDVIKTDEENDIQLLTIKDRTGLTSVVPDKYMSVMDMSSGRLYANKTLVVNISGHPVDETHISLINEINNLVMGLHGVEAKTEVLVTSKEQYVDNTKHELIEASRKNKRLTSWDSSHKKEEEVLAARAMLSQIEDCWKP